MSAGCGGEPERLPGEVVVGLDAPPTALDPRLASDASSALIAGLVHRGLTTSDGLGEVAPDLALSWERPDPVTYRFRLGAARFHTGEPVTAADVVATYESLRAPAFAARRHEALELIADVAAEDAHTVRFTLREPTAVFLQATRLRILPARCAATPDCRTGAGPFRIARAQLDSVQLVAAETADPRPTIAGVSFRISLDSTSRALELARGGIDLVQNAVEPDLLPWLRASGLEVIATPSTTFHYLGVDLRNPSLADLRVRRAIAHAIDRPAITRYLLAGYARPANGLFPPEHWAHAPVAAHHYDPALARRLLQGVGPVRITLKTSTVELRRRIGEAIAAMLGDVGIEVRLRPLEWATLYGDVRRGAFDAYLLAWVGIEEPDHYRSILHSRMVPPHGANRGGFADAEVDALTIAGLRTLDRAERQAIYRRVAELAHDALPFIPLWWVDNVVVKNARLAGFVPSATGDLRSLATARWTDAPAGPS